MYNDGNMVKERSPQKGLPSIGEKEFWLRTDLGGAA
ncbi:unnamed protein product, partial [Onchocerca ochengi]|uniref:Transposase n=1 Tax=Onchocerca ochengi TaxID=42157 RepID=A0A182DXN5_ONCOC